MGQNRQELFICIPLCVAKMLTISPYFWTSESPYFSFHRVGSPAPSIAVVWFHFKTHLLDIFYPFLILKLCTVTLFASDAMIVVVY